MTYAKLIDGELIFAPNPILVDGNRMGNPPGVPIWYLHRARQKPL